MVKPSWCCTTRMRRENNNKEPTVESRCDGMREEMHLAGEHHILGAALLEEVGPPGRVEELSTEPLGKVCAVDRSPIRAAAPSQRPKPKPQASFHHPARTGVLEVRAVRLVVERLDAPVASARLQSIPAHHHR